MNNRLLISLLALQAVSVANAFDPGFYDVEYTGPYKLRGDIRNLKGDISRRKRWGGFDATSLEYMKTPKGQMSYYGNAQKSAADLASTEVPTETTMEWLSNKAFGRTPYVNRQMEHNRSVNQAKRDAEGSLARYEEERQRLQKSVDTLDADVMDMEARLARLKTQVKAQNFGSTRRGRPFTQRFRSWLGSWYK